MFEKYNLISKSNKQDLYFIIGLLEHPLVTHDNSRLIMKIQDEAKKQLGYINE